MQTEKIKELQTIKGIPFPSSMKFRQLLVTGPPGAGKSTLIKRIGGWPEEGGVDISKTHWWRAPTLTFRPREIHLSLPFKGIKTAMAVQEEEWVESAFSQDLDLSRIQIPPPQYRFLPFLNWRTKYVFEFLIQPPEKIFELRKKRQTERTHPIDQNLTLQQVERQVTIYQQVALYFHDWGLLVYLREDFEGMPKRIVTPPKYIAIPTSDPFHHVIESTSVPAKPDKLETLKSFYSLQRNQPTELQEEIFLQGKSVCLAHNGIPVQLLLGKDKVKFHVYPEFPLQKDGEGAYLIFNPDQYFSEISGFLRLNKGESLTIGRDKENKEQNRIFDFPSSVSKRHLRVSHTREGLLFKDLDSDSGTYISTLTHQEDVNRIADWRTKNLVRLKEIFDNNIQLLSSPLALSLIEEVNEILSNENYRPRDSHDQPGGVIMLPDEMTPIIVGDLHAQVNNLLKILSENNFLEKLEQKKAYMLILGDAVHSEIDGELEEMETSLLMMDLLFKLKRRFPQQVFYLRGNHDSFSRELRKSGVPQGILWAKAVLKHRGERYYEEMERFYNQLAYVAIAKDFIACHASPPRGKVTLDMLRNIREHRGLALELIQNRVKRPNYPAGYTKTEVQKFRKVLGVDPKTPFIVSHNPLSRDRSVWLKAGKLKRHHIVFSGMVHEVSLFTKIGDRMMPQTYSAEPLSEWINTLPEKKQSEE